jgi:hypothetical protein
VTNPCQAYRDALLSAGTSGGALPEHASGCAACAAWMRSATRLLPELAGLERMAAPSELEGRVVAALQAGYRQVRVVAAVADLGRVSSPPELDQAVDAELEGSSAERSADSPARLRVPGVLDRLVSEELADLSRARARRYLGSLRRRRAPEELRLRVAGALQSAATTAAQRLNVRQGTRGLPMRFALGLAAAGALVGFGALLSERSASNAAELQPEPIVERVTDPLELSPFAAALLDGASGGLFSARQL